MFLKIAAISAIIFLTHALYCDYNNWWFLNGVEMVWSEKGYTGGGVRGKLRETKSSIRNFIRKACEEDLPKKTSSILVAQELGEYKG